MWLKKYKLLKQASLLLILIVLFGLTSAVLAKEKLIFAIDIIRHGDRTPLRALDRFPYPWKEGLGQLTSQGAHQHELIGKQLREYYVLNEQLLPASYEKDLIYARSTHFERTIKSAQSLLSGLYPSSHNASEEIPIHVQPSESDIFLPNEHALEFNNLLEQKIYSSAVWKAKIEQTQHKWEKWGQLTGWKITHLRDVIRLGNTLYIYHLYQVPFPTGLTQEDTHTLIELFNWGMVTIYRHKEVGDFCGKKPFKQIVKYLMDASTHSTPLKYVLISAHDTTLLSMMSMIEAPLTTSPPYAARLNFSLYEKNNHQHNVVVSFNNEVIEIPICNHSKCPLSKMNEM